MTCYSCNVQLQFSKITDPLIHHTTFGYDEWGPRTMVTSHERKVTRAAHDSRNHVTSVRLPDSDDTASGCGLL